MSSGKMTMGALADVLGSIVQRLDAMEQKAAPVTAPVKERKAAPAKAAPKGDILADLDVKAEEPEEKVSRADPDPVCQRIYDAWQEAVKGKDLNRARAILAHGKRKGADLDGWLGRILERRKRSNRSSAYGAIIADIVMTLRD